MERVRCLKRPAVSYALYLPSHYPDDRRIPILILLDARGRALVPLSLFMPAAEERGWALASSWDSRSDEDAKPTLEAIQAIRRDALERFHVDERRVYLAGFSGTARLAIFVGLTSARPPAGVIACGAGFERDVPPKREMPFVWFGTSGTRDFNHDEMLESAARLEALGAPRRLVVFDGAHQWPPLPVATDALTWMDLQAIRRGLAPPDEPLIARRAAAGSAAARREEAAGKPLAAYREWRSLVRDLSGLADVRPFEKAAAFLEGSWELRQQEGLERKALDEGRRTLSLWARTLRRALNASPPWSVEKLVAELGVARLRKTAASVGDPEQSEAADRLLSALRVRTSFYLPAELRAAGDLRGVALALGVADAVRPGDPEVLYDLACARALSGEDAAALEALRRAVAAGFCDRRRLETEPDLARMHGDPGFEGLLEAAPR